LHALTIGATAEPTIKFWRLWRARPDEVMDMTGMMLIGLAAAVLVVVVAGLLDRLLDFDDLSSSADQTD
jgi:hypothetical protein